MGLPAPPLPGSASTATHGAIVKMGAHRKQACTVGALHPQAHCEAARPTAPDTRATEAQHTLGSCLNEDTLVWFSNPNFMVSMSRISAHLSASAAVNAVNALLARADG